ncbi:MAG: hypothetical protein IID45_00340 [Planctomycetes bacterium]|nr:hypothetical protein [Planctomycetota bacterium]
MAEFVPGRIDEYGLRSTSSYRYRPDWGVREVSRTKDRLPAPPNSFSREGERYERYPPASGCWAFPSVSPVRKMATVAIAAHTDPRV